MQLVFEATVEKLQAAIKYTWKVSHTLPSIRKKKNNSLSGNWHIDMPQLFLCTYINNKFQLIPTDNCASSSSDQCLIIYTQSNQFHDLITSWDMPMCACWHVRAGGIHVHVSVVCACNLDPGGPTSCSESIDVFTTYVEISGVPEGRMFHHAIMKVCYTNIMSSIKINTNLERVDCNYLCFLGADGFVTFLETGTRFQKYF